MAVYFKVVLLASTMPGLETERKADVEPERKVSTLVYRRAVDAIGAARALGIDRIVVWRDGVLIPRAI